jgi:S1-C subfamily serine protease
VLITGVAAHSDSAHKGVAPGDVILRVENKPVASAAEVRADLKAARAAKRGEVMLLLWPKVRETPGPKWVALELGPQGN